MACCSRVGNLSTTHSYGVEPKVRYSNIDRRKNIYEIKNEEEDFYKTVAVQSQSVACMIHKNFFQFQKDEGLYFVDAETLKAEQYRIESTRFGEHEMFRNEPVPGSGTVFLVGSDPSVESPYAMTAGHCVCVEKTETIDIDIIKNYRIVFGFQKSESKQIEYKFQVNDIYKIKKVIAYNYHGEKDWAFIKLDRKVEGRKPLPTSFLSKAALKTSVYMLGHPTGLPLKFSDGAKIRADTHSCYYADLDSFKGNSGSPVFDKKTHKVIGILVRGPQPDYHITDNYLDLGVRRVQVRQAGKDEGYEAIQKLNQLAFVRHYLKAKQQDSLRERYFSDFNNNELRRNYHKSLRAMHKAALDFNYGNDVQRNYAKAMKWLQKAASRGYEPSQIELKDLPERNAVQALTLRSRGWCCQQSTKAGMYLGTFLVGIIFPPITGWLAYGLSYEIDYCVQSRTFELLALDDERFNLFSAISRGDLDEANQELNKHADLYNQLVKTHAFHMVLGASKYEYVKFFKEKNMIQKDVRIFERRTIF